ncbi:hypothetical protein PN836_007945 [Ningiella sp. W23]|uniref:hypothetical protein n=1 Tax=Ningiella sp. W23 TaxID=3023715 RepID=UPI00375774CE
MTTVITIKLASDQLAKGTKMVLSDFISNFSKLTSGAVGCENQVYNPQSLLVLHANIMKLQSTDGEAPLKDQTDILHDLFLLKAEISRASKISATRGQAHERFMQNLDEAVQQNLKVNQAAHLFDDVAKIQQELSEKDTNDKNSRRFKQRMLVLVSLIPFFGLGLHYFNGMFYQKMFADKVHMVFPVNIYESGTNQLKIAQSKRGELYEQYSRYIYDDYIDNGVSDLDNGFTPVSGLPTVYDLSEMSDYLEDFSTLTEAQAFIARNPADLRFYEATELERLQTEMSRMDPAGIMSPKFPFFYQLRQTMFDAPSPSVERFSQFHLHKFRVLIRNIRNNHLVNEFAFVLSSLDEPSFDPKYLPTEARIELELPISSIGQDVQNYLSVKVKDAPVKNFIATTLALDEQNVIVDTAEIKIDGLLSAEEDRKLAFTKQIINYSNDALWGFDPKMFYQQNANQSSLPAHINVVDLSDMTSLHEIEYGFKAEQAEYFVRCEDGGAVYLLYSSLDALSQNLEIINELKIAYEYELIDGSKRRGQDSINPKYAFVLPEGTTGGQDMVVSCLGPQLYDSLVDNATGAAGPDVRALPHRAAQLLMGSENTVKSDIVLASEILISPLDLNRYTLLPFDTPQVLQDGNYLQLDVWAVNLNDGIYQLQLFADGEHYDTVDIEVFMPPVDLDLTSINDVVRP